MWQNIFPFLAWGSLINRESIRADIIAGITGAVIVLPQGVAFAMIAGLPPEYGLYTAMITPVIAALFGSSNQLISGPTVAISIVVFSAIQPYAEPASPDFIRLAIILTFLVGIFQFIMGLARMGTLVNFVSHTVIIAFTAGAAVLIITSQIKHILGIEVESSGTFFHTWLEIFQQLGNTNFFVFVVAISTLAVALLLRRFLPKSPYLLIAMVLGSLISYLFNGESLGVSLVGRIPGNLPPFSSPDLSFSTVKQLAPEAFAIALLGLIEAVSIARSIATRSHQRIDGNQEFIGQGLSNIVGSFFSSYAGSGSFTRSGVNYEAGAKTPMAGIFSAVFLALILLFIAPLTAYLPIPAMGGIILLAGYNLIDFEHIKGILKASKSETAILLVTFLSTLFFALEFAIYIGVILSLIFYLQQTSRPKIDRLAPIPHSTPRKFAQIEQVNQVECPQLVTIRIEGSLFFGAVDHVEKYLRHLSDEEPLNLLIVGDSISLIDIAGAELLVQQARIWKAKGGGIYFAGLKKANIQFLQRGEYWQAIGESHFFPSKKAAIAQLFPLLNPAICANCTARIFQECGTLPA